VILWLDAQISPKLCPWIRRKFEAEAHRLGRVTLDRVGDLRLIRVG